MSNKKLKFKVEIYETTTETHEVTVDKEVYDKIGFNIFDYISEDSLIDREWHNSDYKIIQLENINE